MNDNHPLAIWTDALAVLNAELVKIIEDIQERARMEQDIVERLTERKA
jgi:hypothetical protein